MKNALLKLNEIYDITPKAIKGLTEHYGYFKLLTDYYSDLIVNINNGEKPVLYYYSGYDEEYGEIYFFLVILEDKYADKVLNFKYLNIVIKEKYHRIHTVPRFQRPEHKKIVNASTYIL